MLLDELCCRFHPDARHPRDIVARVPGERQDVAHPLRANAEPLLHFRRPDQLVLHRVPHGNPFADELHEVLVGGYDQDLARRLPRPFGVARDDVVGFKAFLLHRREIEGQRRLAHERELRRKLGRRCFPVGLVVLVDRVPEARRPGIEHDDDVVVRPVLQQPKQHVGEAEHGVHRYTVRPRHRR